MVTLERNLLRLMSEINIKKYRNKKIKTINVGMACQKACEQGREDIKVKAKIYKAPSLHAYFHTRVQL